MWISDVYICNHAKWDLLDAFKFVAYMQADVLFMEVNKQENEVIKTLSKFVFIG